LVQCLKGVFYLPEEEADGTFIKIGKLGIGSYTHADKKELYLN